MSLTTASPTECAKAASLAARKLAILPVTARNLALQAIHSSLISAKQEILAANRRDLEEAHTAAGDGKLSQSLIKRLDLGRAGKYEDMLQGILDVKNLADPLGRTTLRKLLDDDLELERVSIPIGTLLIIFEARPEVIANISALAIKSGNAALLKGGKESSHTFSTISNKISEALSSTEVPNAAIQLIARSSVPELLSLDHLIDLVIPRGSNELVRYVKDNTKIPVLGHADGLCAAYLEKDADVAIAKKILVDAKLGYTAACNAIETLLVHRALPQATLAAMVFPLVKAGVELHCDPFSYELLSELFSKMNYSNAIKRAADMDFDTEFLLPVLAVKFVLGVQQAIEHINSHSSHHTDIIITEDAAIAEHFMDAVDSAGVYWNVSSRFADGQRYGLGTEVGISTNKIHARGPVGLEGLTTYKYKIRGRGQTAGEYGSGLKQFKHVNLPLGREVNGSTQMD